MLSTSVLTEEDVLRVKRKVVVIGLRGSNQIPKGQ